MVLTNVLGPALTIRAVLPHFLERDAGHFLITSSVAGRRALPGSLYSATKHAATAMGEALRAELRQMRDNFSVRVTLIEPGMTDTRSSTTSRREHSSPTTSPARCCSHWSSRRTWTSTRC
jgi:NADP-dependent 3-hydroxy acid dehydrogenase YdfG